MNLGTLLKRLGTVCDIPDREITAVTEKAEDVKEGSLFVAVRGQKHDGNDSIPLALSRKAAAIITDGDFTGENVIRVSDARRAYSFLCSAFYGDPQDKLKIIGVTGTNGKTTTALYIRHILENAGIKCGVIGTLGSICGTYKRDTGYTTPCAQVLFEELDRFVSLGAQCAVIEVSSQALAQYRADPIEFELGIFTNIGRDHLDYHGSAEEYLRAKLRLQALCKKVLVNKDSFYEGVFDSKKSIFFSAKDFYADISAKNIRQTDNMLNYLILAGETLTRVRINGSGNILLYNSLCAAGASLIYGISQDKVSEALATLPVIRGRLEKIYSGSFMVYVDYAHTPDALFAVLSHLRKECHEKLICVFGCGGNRDKGKRSEMGSVAGALCDMIVITNDNPRNEDPEEIAQDIISGINNKNNIYKELDRVRAIEYALKKAQTGDIVLIAGKGHELSQQIKDEKKYFSDEITVKKILGV